MRTRFRPDHGLSARMAFTMGILGLLYVVFIAVLIVLMKSVFAVLLIAGALLAAQYWFSDRIALLAMRARIVSEDEAPELHGIFDRLCALADMPKPRIAIADTDLPNAFATGRNSRVAVVCVTTGLMDRLDPAELEGVLAHELSHIAHRDVAVMTIASFLGVLAGLVARLTFYSGMFGRRRDNTALLVLAVMAVSTAVYLISYLLLRALSRYRELAADRAGAVLTGRPSDLASALTKITDEMARIPSRDLREVQAFNAFFLVPAVGSGLAGLLATHPPLDRRLDQLARLSAELGEGVGR
jgi:heat shock protein HtpX